MIAHGETSGTAESRRRFLADNQQACEALLKCMWTDLKGESPESWQALRFKHTGEAVKWARDQWCSEKFDPGSGGWSLELLPCERSTFAVADFWELLRLTERQTLDRQADAGRYLMMTRELGQKRQELTLSNANHLENLALEDDDCPGKESMSVEQTVNAEPGLEVSLEQLADKVLATLDALATRVHSALPVLWLEQQLPFRMALNAYFGQGLFGPRVDASLPECVIKALPPARSKASSLALFRFVVLFETMSLDRKKVDDAAFCEIYLHNVENPTWPTKVRDRWDVVPKAVAAARLQKLNFPVGPNQVREAARDRLGQLVRAFMERVRNRTNPDDFPERRSKAVTLLLGLVLARDSITKTLQDEYARSDRPGASDGPGSAVIQHWHTEINETLDELRTHLNALQEDHS